ncbi:MAG TPA: PDZ domain-containing protein [Longimicrobium sp.]
MWPRIVLAAALAAALGPGLSAQRAAAAGCTDPHEIAAARLNASRITLGTPSAGYHGIRYGARISIGPNGAIGWATNPVVEAVYCGSPADSAGVHQGDVLLTVNGHDAREAGILAATRPGMTFRLRVRRDARELEFTVVSIPRPPEAR